MRLRNSKQHVYEFVERYITRNRRAPTIQEVMRQFDFHSPASVDEIYRKLEDDGLIVRVRNVSRGVRLVGPINPS